MNNKHGFTLIELLIVIAIIAILALIAVPNFLEAQTRAKVTTAYSDMRTYQLALQTYQIDNGRFLMDLGGRREEQDWARLTTPIAYMTRVFYSPFKSTDQEHFGDSKQEPYWYGDTSNDPVLVGIGMFYVMGCAGPDNDEDWGRYMLGTQDWFKLDQRTGHSQMIYSATNGTVSSGDIVANNKTIFQ